MKPFNLFLSALVLFFSCQEDTEVSKLVIGSTTFSSNTVFIDKENWQNSIIQIDTLDGLFTFSNDPGLKTGDIMISEADEGFIRKVTQVEAGSQGVVVSTEFASICDAVEEASASLQRSIVPDLKSGQLYLEEGVNVSKTVEKTTNNPCLGFDINVIIYDRDGNTNTENDQVTLNGYYGMSSELEAQVEIKKFELEEFSLTYHINESASVSIASSTVVKDFSVIKEKRIAKHPFAPIVLFPGCIITPVLEIYAGVDLTNQADFSVQVEKSKQYSASLNYNKGSWSTSKTIEENELSGSIDLKGTSTFKAYLKPKLLLKINGVIAPKLEAELYNQLEASLSLQGIDYEISKGFEMGVGIEMKIFNKKLLDFTENFFDFKAVIKQGTIASFTGVKPEAAFVASKQSIKEGESVQFSDQSLNTPTTWTWNFGDSSPGSSSQHPSHTYLAAGTYTVSLTASNSYGSDTETKVSYMTVQEPEVQPTALNDELISYWNIDETSGTIINDAHSNNNCTVNSGVTINQAGIRGRAASFTSTSGGLTTGKKASALGIGGSLSKSVSIWIKPDASLNGLNSCGIVDLGSRSNQQQFGIKYYGAPAFWMFDSWYGTVRVGANDNKLADGEWHHIVVTYNSDGHKVRTYLDGQFVTEDATKTLNTGDTYGFSIGIGSQGKFVGLIDEVGLWSRPLTDNEVNQLYNSGSGLQYPF